LMQPLGSRKPSEMMAAMLEYCPRGEEKTNLFACLFCRGCPERLGCCWPESTTRILRPWPSRRTSCGPFMTDGRMWWRCCSRTARMGIL
jgi:hypothetical protein